MVIHLIPVLLAAAAVKAFTDSDSDDSDDERPPPPPVTHHPPPRPQAPPYRPPPQPAPPQYAPKPQPPPSVAVVLTHLSHNVKPIADRLRYAPADLATPEGLTPVINHIGGAFQTASNNVRQLWGKPANIVLASADGTTILNAAHIGDLLGSIVERLFVAIDVVLSLTSADLYEVVRLRFVPLGQVMLDLVNVVVHLVDGTLNIVGPALGSVLSIISTLGLGDVVDEILGNSR